MKRLAFGVGLGLVLGGCSGGNPPTTAQNPPKVDTQASPQGAEVAHSNALPNGSSAPQGGQDGVQILSPAAGGMSPVTGSENIQGDGGAGVGMVAKDRARQAASQASQTSMAQGSGDAEQPQ